VMEGKGMMAKVLKVREYEGGGEGGGVEAGGGEEDGGA
jgi:hypothetical protein